MQVVEAIRQTVTNITGMLPPKFFSVSISANNQDLAQLMYTAMMTGYMFRNAQYRLELRTSISGSLLEGAVCNIDCRPLGAVKPFWVVLIALHLITPVPLRCKGSLSLHARDFQHICKIVSNGFCNFFGWAACVGRWPGGSVTPQPVYQRDRANMRRGHLNEILPAAQVPKPCRLPDVLTRAFVRLISDHLP